MKRAVLGLVGAVMVAAAMVRYPPDPSLRFEPGPRALADRLAALGVTYVLVNSNNAARYRTWFVEGYGPREHERALARLDAFLARHTTPVLEDRGVVVRRLGPATAAGR